MVTSSNKSLLFTLKILVTVLLISLAVLVKAELDDYLEFRFRNMPFSNFVNYFNRQNHSFKITHYNNLPLVLSIEPPSKSKLITQLHSPKMMKNLPQIFDARQKWPHCFSISEVYHQGKCGSCWTFGVGTTASDRTCIHTGINIRLSEQDFKCCTTCYNTTVCKGGDPDAAFIFWQNDGLVSLDCKAYNVTDLENNNTCPYKCDDNTIDYITDKHYAESVYNIDNCAEQIKAELFHNGPIKGSFPVYRDFKEYLSGIYERKFGELLGYHSVRIVGYGTENGIDYWLVANSWGDEWGEDGFFRIKQFQDNRSLETHLQSGLPRSKMYGVTSL